MKKNRLIHALASLVIIGGAVGYLVSCDRDTTENPNPGGTGTTNDGEIVEFSIGLSSSKDISVGETISVVPTVVSPTNYEEALFVYDSNDSSVATVDDNGKITGVSAGTATISVTCDNFGGDVGEETKTVDVTVSGEASYATGAYTYAGSDYEDSLEILGKLEEYALNNNLTGITLFESGGYVMYNDRITKGTETYISGYGFGILAEGQFTAPNSYYEESGYGYYYHSYAGTSNAGKFNYLDDTGSVTSDLYSYVAGSYYSTRMNSTKDGYEWYPQLANEFSSTDPDIPASSLTSTQLNRPVALNKNASTGLATQYRIYLKTGYKWDGVQGNYSETYANRDDTNGLFYQMSTESDYYDEFDNTPVSIEDYVTPYMALLNGSVGLARSSDMISDSSDGTLKGARSFYNATRSNSDITDEQTKAQFFDIVGIDIGLDGDPSSPDAPCITFTLNKPLSEFDAMYALSTTLVSPISMDFLEEIGDGDANAGIKDAYGKSYTVTGTTPVDNMITVGTHILDYSDTFEIRYSRNADFIDKFEQGRYHSSIEGVNLHYLSSMLTDSNSAFEQFIELDYFDAISIPQDYIDQYRDDPRTTVTQGESTFKLNVNSCTQDEWEAIFGYGGDNYNDGQGTWNCNPLMSNDKFVQALSYAIDRETFAYNRGYVPSQDYFADAYMWEPEQGYSYNETDQHIGNLADRSPETYGYNFDVAVALMDQAIEEEINAGNFDGYIDYTNYNGTSRGTNDKGIIQISWMNTTDPDDYGDEILGYWQAAFEATDAYQKGFRISFTQVAGTSNYQDVYNTMSYGLYDIGFGSISGMTLDPLGFMEVLQSNNDAGFTLNYSGDTDVIDEEDGKVIYYDGKKWSFDGLWEAANNGAIISSTNYQLVDNPVTMTYADNMQTTRNDEEVIWIAINYRKAVDAAGATMRLTTEEGLSDETFTVTGTYTNGSDTETVTFNLSLEEYAVLDTSGSLTDPLTDDQAGGIIDIYIPYTLSTDLTYLDNPITATDLTSVSIYLEIYTTYYASDADTEGITISSSYTIPSAGTISFN